ncbi:spondin domain-containing protein [Glaciecola siphonariae]|uniref:Spondin domain-containing protein n=1 Tax=Glaciecola siphonariae TaxID=521012 RepID=A0ABV9LS57_9ALTE
MKKYSKILGVTLTMACLLGTQAHATKVEVEVSNLFAEGGLALTPLWAGFHDGSFDTFNAGETASASLQALAEEGNAAGIIADFNASSSNGVTGLVFGPEGFAGAPVIEPGEVTSAMFNIDAVNNGYFSFLSMLIPTNDAFIGNDAPDAYSLFDSLGNFVGLDIIVVGANVWDSGTELNRGFGSPFLIGAGAEPRQDENGVVGLSNGLGVLPGGFSIIGGMTPAGYSIDALAADFTAQGFEVARISVSEVSAPAAMSGFGAIALLLIGMRRKLFGHKA